MINYKVALLWAIVRRINILIYYIRIHVLMVIILIILVKFDYSKKLK